MKKVIIALVLFGAMFFTTSAVSARGIIFYSNGEKIETVEEYPDSVIIGNEHVNLGVMYDQFSIFWIPVWNYGETRHVLTNDAEDTYWDLDAEGIEFLKTNFNVDVPETPTIGFWNRIGGKIIWGIVIIAILAGWLFGRKDDDDTPAPKTTETPDTTN